MKLGVDRPTYAADCLNAVLLELFGHADAGRCKLVLAADGINALFCQYTLIHKDHLAAFGRKTFTNHYRINILPVDDFSVFRTLKKAIK